MTGLFVVPDQGLRRDPWVSSGRGGSGVLSPKGEITAQGETSPAQKNATVRYPVT